MKDLLFLLKPGFQDGEGAPYYCPHCTIFEGLLCLYPKLAGELEVHRVDFQRPRPELVELLGQEHQSCPVLVAGAAVEGLEFKEANGRKFLDDPEVIGIYLSRVYGIPRPH